MMESFGKLKPLSFDQQGAGRVVLASAETCWSGIPFELHDLAPVEGPLEMGPVAGRRGWMITLSGTQTSVIATSRRELKVVTTPGTVAFADGSRRIPVTRASGHARAAVFDLPRSWYDRMLAEGGPKSFAGLAPLPAHETARALALAMCSEVEAGAPTGALFAESLSTALLSYVLERLPSAPIHVRGSLSAGQCRRLRRYIDDHLEDDITLSAIAAEVGLRQRHFSTLFRRAFGVTPHQFLINRRLERGAGLLASTRADISEIALQVGFSSQSHFASAFRKRYGVSPRQYALNRQRSSDADS